jgi:serine acetyltransferase
MYLRLPSSASRPDTEQQQPYAQTKEIGGVSMKQTHPKNIYISNNVVARLYLNLRRYHVPVLPRLLGLVMGTEINCPLPKRLFLPHPYGIVVGSRTILEDDVVLMQQVTLGGKDPHWGSRTLEGAFPIIRRGAYVGAGAKILGHVEIGEFAIVGANAVITKNVAPYARAVGHNQITENETL